MSKQELADHMESFGQPGYDKDAGLVRGRGKTRCFSELIEFAETKDDEKATDLNTKESEPTKQLPLYIAGALTTPHG